MSWAFCGKDSKGRSIGYGVPAICDHPGCKSAIDRGLAFACGGMHGNETIGRDVEVCDEYFCPDHMRYNAVADTFVCFNCDVLLGDGPDEDEDEEDDEDEPVMWSSLLDVIPFIRELESDFAAVGWHIALGGGVLKTGHSDHDLDLVVFPHNSNETNMENVRTVLKGLGWRLHADVERVQSYWRKKGLTDRKHVEVWVTPDDRRVDLIFPHRTT